MAELSSFLPFFRALPVFLLGSDPSAFSRAVECSHGDATERSGEKTTPDSHRKPKVCVGAMFACM